MFTDIYVSIDFQVCIVTQWWKFTGEDLPLVELILKIIINNKLYLLSAFHARDAGQSALQ